MLTNDDIAVLVKDFYETILAKNDDFRLMSDAPDGWRGAKVGYYARVAKQARIDLASNAFDAVQDITAVMLTRHHGLDAKFDKLTVRRVSQALLRAGVDIAETLKARAEGDFNYEPRDKLLLDALARMAASSVEPNSAIVLRERSELVGPLFSVAAEIFREAQIRRKVWEQQTALQARKTYELFAELRGDKPLADYTRRDAAAFKALLEDLPANYGKAAEFRGMRASAIVEACVGREVDRLSSRTVQRHFAALSAFWDPAVEQEQTTTNIFGGWKFAGAKRARDQREMWKREHLKVLFETPLWRGCQSEHRRSRPGCLVLRDEKFWLPLIAVFSGMRQEEICQLRVADIRETEGIWVFDLNARDGQQLKNSNAVRLVPVHAELIRMGWLDHVARGRSNNAHMVFPALQPGGADDRLGHNYSKWFTRYRQDLRLYVAGRDFHSFRHSATTFMRQAGVATDTIDELTGHATAGETARYNKGQTVANLKVAIDAIDIGLDFSWLSAHCS